MSRSLTFPDANKRPTGVRGGVVPVEETSECDVWCNVLYLDVEEDWDWDWDAHAPIGLSLKSKYLFFTNVAWSW